MQDSTPRIASTWDSIRRTQDEHVMPPIWWNNHFSFLKLKIPANALSHCCLPNPQALDRESRDHQLLGQFPVLWWHSCRKLHPLFETSKPLLLSLRLKWSNKINLHIQISKLTRNCADCLFNGGNTRGARHALDWKGAFLQIWSGSTTACTTGFPHGNCGWMLWNQALIHCAACLLTNFSNILLH